MRALRLWLLVIGVVLVFAAGCGGDDDSESEGSTDAASENEPEGASDLSDDEQAYVD